MALDQMELETMTLKELGKVSEGLVAQRDANRADRLMLAEVRNAKVRAATALAREYGDYGTAGKFGHNPAKQKELLAEIARLEG